MVDVVRRFLLVRRSDPSGISGTGVVAEGVRFGDGTLAVRWTCASRSTAVWDSVDDMLAVHGHAGRTVVRWLDSANQFDGLDAAFADVNRSMGTSSISRH